MSFFGEESDYVGPEGELSAKIALVLEAPGATEVRMKRPAVGNAGTLNDKLLNHAGIGRAECYITNVFKRPIRKSGDNFFIDDVKVYNQKTGQFTDAGWGWVEQLYEELATVKSNVIMAVGGVALSALLNFVGITKYRGSVYAASSIGGRKVIPTLHPSSAFHNFMWRYHIIFDYRKALKESEFPAVVRKERTAHYKPTLHEAVDFMRHLSTLPEIAFDIEMLQGKTTCVGIGTDVECMVIPFHYDSRTNYWMEHEEKQILIELHKLLNNQKQKAIGQNTLFDQFMLMRELHIVATNLEDTLMAQHMIYTDFPKGLDYLTSVYSDLPYYKDEGKKWFKVPGSMQKLWEYNAKDVFATFDVWQGLKKELEASGVKPYYDRTLHIYPAMQYMSQRGIKVDTEALAEVRGKVSSEVDQIRKEIHELAGRELNPNSPKQCREYFYGTLGIPAYKDPKTGKPSTGNLAMRRLAAGTASRKPLEIASKIILYRGLQKLLSSYLQTTLDEDNRLRCAIKPYGTPYSRWATEKTLLDTGMSMQNLPQPYKKFLVADPGCVFIEIDKAQAEWVVCAYLFQEANMMAAVEQGLDVHAATAHYMTNAPFDLIQKEKKLLGHTTDITEIAEIRKTQLPEVLKYDPIKVMSLRQAGKKSNHALNYDMRVPMFAIQYEVPLTEARRIYSLYHKAYPGIRRGHAMIREQVRRERTLKNLFGRPHRFYDRLDDRLFKSAYSCIPQSTVVELVNGAIESVYYTEKEWASLIEMLMQVHDSVLFQYFLHKSSMKQMAQTIIDIFEYMDVPIPAHGSEFRIASDFSIGFNWGEASEHNPLGMVEVDFSKDIHTLTNNLTEWYKKTGQRDVV